MRTSSERDVEEEEVQEDNTVRTDWILVLQKSKRRTPVIGESRRKITSRVSMTVTCVSALASLGGGAKKSILRMFQGQQVNSH